MASLSRAHHQYSQSLLGCLFSFIRRGLHHVEIVVKAILQGHLVEVFAHLLTPLVHHPLTKTWQLTALGQLRHKLVTVLPLLKSLDLLNLTCSFVLTNVEEGRGVANLAKEGHLILLLELEERHLG